MTGREERELHDEVVQKGGYIAIIDAVEDERMDDWTRQIAAASGQKIAWIRTVRRRYFLALGDLEKARRTLAELVPLAELNGRTVG